MCYAAPMPLPVITGVQRVAMIWTVQGGGHAVTVLHFSAPAISSSQLANDIDTNATANMWSHTTTSTKVTELHVTKLDGSSATFIKPVTGAKWAGTSVSDAVPAVACLVKLATGLRGPANRGRLFLPDCAEPTIADGSMVGSTLTSSQNAWSAFFAAMTALGDLLVVASYKHATGTIVTSVVVESKLGTQRRRQSRLR